MNSSGQDTVADGLGKPRIGIIGGSGMCSFPELRVISTCRPETQYGMPSDDITLCEYEGVQVAFLPRHGVKHTLPPHKVPYKANLAAMKALGVQYVLGTCIVGSLRKNILPGSLVIPDQFVNLTWGRDDSSGVDGGSFVHLPMGEPYCSHMREKLAEAAKASCASTVLQGTVAVIQGPRFSTRAESRWLSANGWDIVNMTQYPECYFARELGLCYAALAAVTDYDVGLQESLVVDPCHMGPVLEVFRDNIHKTKETLFAFLRQTESLSCSCASVVIKAYYEANLTK